MYCRMIQGAYLRANGEMACYCGPGEEISLAQIPFDGGDFDFILDGYRNKAHRNVGERMREGILPYPHVCMKCIYLEPLKSLASEDDRQIEWMHVEATSQCNLNCSFCIPQKDRAKFRKPPHFIPQEAFGKIVNDIANHEMRVKWMYFSGRGESGLHPHLWEMVALAKSRLGTDFLVNTNGNIPYNDLIVDSGLDKIKIAVDGATDSVYRMYRKGGRLDRVVDLTQRIAKRKAVFGARSPKIIWQFILFSFNDTDEQVEGIQRLAMDCGVDELLIKSTFTSGFSTRPLDRLPRIHPSVVTLDLRAMVDANPSALEEHMTGMDKRIEDGEWEQALPLGLEVAKSIFRHFILGIERKESYNMYGQKGDLEFMSHLARTNPDEFGAQLNMLPVVSRRIAECYAKQGRPEVGTYYANLAKRIENETTSR